MEEIIDVTGIEHAALRTASKELPLIKDKINYIFNEIHSYIATQKRVFYVSN